MSSSDWSDTKVILHELEQLFNRDDDIKDILDIKKMETEIESQCINRLRDAKEIIKFMTQHVAAKELEIKAPTQSEHAAALLKASNKENQTLQNEAIARNIDMKRQNIAKMSATILSLKERANEFSSSTKMADSRTAYAISLYAKISNITWDYKAPPGKLSGCIGDDQKKEIRSFDLDTRSKTSFEVANELWDLIGESLPADSII